MATHTGGCHCGRVRFEVIAPAKLDVADCNCSMCSKCGYLHLIVPADRFKLISGRDVLTTYSFNTHIAKHFFCSVCGVKSFYVPRSHPDGISVNARCIDSDNHRIDVGAAVRWSRMGKRPGGVSRRVRFLSAVQDEHNAIVTLDYVDMEQDQRSCGAIL